MVSIKKKWLKRQRDVLSFILEGLKTSQTNGGQSVSNYPTVYILPEKRRRVKDSQGDVVSPIPSEVIICYILRVSQFCLLLQMSTRHGSSVVDSRVEAQ